MFALILREDNYACGNVLGVYDTMPGAQEALWKLEGEMPQDMDYNLQIMEFELNRVYPTSLTGCAGCMSELEAAENTPVPTLRGEAWISPDKTAVPAVPAEVGVEVPVVDDVVK